MAKLEVPPSVELVDAEHDGEMLTFNTYMLHRAGVTTVAACYAACRDFGRCGSFTLKLEMTRRREGGERGEWVRRPVVSCLLKVVSSAGPQRPCSSPTLCISGRLREKN